MIGIVLVTHGRLAVEFRAALEHVVGPQDQIEAVTIGPDDDVERRRRDIIEAVKQVDSGDGVVILTDMFGGTPSNLSISVMNQPRVEVLAGGLLQQCDTPRQLYDNPVNQFVAGFIGSPAMNLQTVPLVDGGVQLAGTTLPLPPAVRTAATEAGLRELVLGIRPEHLHLADGAGELPGEVMLVEELGADALLHVRLAGGGEAVVARAEGRKPPSPGQEVTFHVQPDDVFAFHPGTGARLAG